MRSLLTTLALLGIGLFSQQSRAKATYLAGAEEINIDPEGLATLGGYRLGFLLRGWTRRNDQGQDLPLIASAMALSGSEDQTSLILISVDCIGLSQRFINSVEERITKQITHSQAVIVIAASHTHHAPDTLGLWGPLPFTGRDPAYMKNLAERIVQTAIAAYQKRQPANLSWLNARYPNSTSALVSEQRDDKLLTVIATAANGQVIASLTNWSAHPTLIGGASRKSSSGYVGAFRQALRQEYGPGVHMFFNGSLGNVYPVHQSQVHTEELPDQFQAAKDLGKSLASVVMSAWPSAIPITSRRIRGATFHVPMKLTNSLFRWAGRLGLLEFELADNDILHVPLTWLQIGSIMGVTIPGELYPRGSQLLRKFLHQKGGQGILIFGIAEDALGYLLGDPEREDPSQDRFESLAPHPQGLDIIVDAYRRQLGVL